MTHLAVMVAGIDSECGNTVAKKVVPFISLVAGFIHIMLEAQAL